MPDLLVASYATMLCSGFGWCPWEACSSLTSLISFQREMVGKEWGGGEMQSKYVKELKKKNNGLKNVT